MTDKPLPRLEYPIDPNATVTHAREGSKKLADLQATDEQVDYIFDLMANLRWETGKTGKHLAKIWGLSKDVVQRRAAEASRRVRANPEDAQRDITAGARQLFREAVSTKNAKDAKLMGDLWLTVSGAAAPQKFEHTVESADPNVVRARFVEMIASPSDETIEALREAFRNGDDRLQELIREAHDGRCV